MKSIFAAALLILSITSGCNSSSKNNNETMPKSEVSLAFEIKAQLGEGALWNHKNNTLYWIDIEGKILHVFDPKSTTNEEYVMPSRIGTVVARKNNEALVALENGVFNYNFNTRQTTPFVLMEKELEGKRLNDGKCDPSGRLWVGSMHFDQLKGQADLYSIDSIGTLSTKIENVTISNGIVWTADSKTMYYIDTPSSQIKAYDFDSKTGVISNERVAVNVPESLGYPDGMAIDSDDMVWVGMWNGDAVVKFDPKTGDVLQKIEVPAHNITSCAFGGKDLDTLYITTARLDMTPAELEKYPLAGSLFKVVPGVKGVKSPLFK